MRNADAELSIVSYRPQAPTETGEPGRKACLSRQLIRMQRCKAVKGLPGAAALEATVFSNLGVLLPQSIGLRA